MLGRVTGAVNRTPALAAASLRFPWRRNGWEPILERMSPFQLASTWQHRLYAGEEPLPCELAVLPRFLAGMIFQGVWWAGYILVPFVLAKSLGAPEGLVTLAVIMDTGGMLLAIYWGHLLGRGSRASLIFWGGLVGRLAFLGGFLVRGAGQFVVLLAVVYFFAALVYPAQNGILQLAFRPSLQGRIWGLGTSVQNLTAVITSLVVSRILDRHPAAFAPVYAAIGLCGCVYMIVLARLDAGLENGELGPACGSPPARPRLAGPPGSGLLGLLPLPALGPLTPGRLLRGMVRPFAEVVATFRQDRAYLWYEINFMIYGLAFLMLAPMQPLLFGDRLGLSYEQISTGRIMIAQLGVALLSPLMGRISDRHHPAGLCQLAFAVMAGFPLGLMLAQDWHVDQPARLVYLAFVVYAVGMAGVNIGWNVGSISFAPAGLGRHYQGVHVSMVGVRGLLGPAVGFLVYEFWGLDRVFLLASALLLTASFSSGALKRWLVRRRVAA
jgi:hypothetical protein